ncbi:DoxX family protein [Bradyrhizobium sp. 23AC]
MPPLARLRAFSSGTATPLLSPSLFAQYFASVHVPLPNAAFWIAAIIHLVGGLAVPLGFKTRWAAALPALLSVATAFGVHLPIGDQENTMNFYKNPVMTGSSST